MNDTPPAVAAEIDALLARRSGADRLRMTCEMFDLARALAVAAIKADEPGIDAAQLRVRLFERFYAGDLTHQDRARIVATLR